MGWRVMQAHGTFAGKGEVGCRHNRTSGSCTPRVSHEGTPDGL